MRNNYCLIWELSYGFWGNFSCVFGAQKWWPYSGMGVHNLNCCCLLSSIGSVAIKQQFADLETKFNSILHTISKLLLKSAHNLQQRWKNFYSTKSRLGSFFLTGKSWGCASVINRKLFPSLIKISWIYELKNGGKKLVMSFLLLPLLLGVYSSEITVKVMISGKSVITQAFLGFRQSSSGWDDFFFLLGWFFVAFYRHFPSLICGAWKIFSFLIMRGTLILRHMGLSRINFCPLGVHSSLD